VGILLGPMSAKKDLETEAAYKRPGNDDCKTQVKDEGNKKTETNHELMMQTAIETGFTTVSQCLHAHRLWRLTPGTDMADGVGRSDQLMEKDDGSMSQAWWRLHCDQRSQLEPR
jgi:hypothetical protein